MALKSGSQDVGHPSIDLQINPNAGRIIGVSIQSTQVTAVITDVSPNILWRKEIDLPKIGGMEMGLLTVKSLIQEVCNLNSQPKSTHSGARIEYSGYGRY